MSNLVLPLCSPGQAHLDQALRYGEEIEWLQQLDELSTTALLKPASRWTPDQLEQNLPPDSGVYSTFLYSLEQLQQALVVDWPELVELLMRRVLPVLAVCRQLLTLEELAWAVGVSIDDRVSAAVLCRIALDAGL
jgi:hypothetical protein